MKLPFRNTTKLSEASRHQKKKITDTPRQKNESAASHTIKPVEEPASTPNPETIHEDEHTGDDLLEEIRSKKKLRPETNKQKEQLHIIDQFIKKQPSITKNSLPAIDSPDLAEKSISLTDNIVSETLVEILLRQGKKDKAIEVLKKLIWKFPQKKSIFAAQIEELRR